MVEKENTILKSLDKRVGALEDNVKSLDKKVWFLDKKVEAIDKKIDGFVVKFDERMDRFEESNRKTGLLLEKLDSKFDFALEGSGSLKTLIEGMNDRVTALEGFA